MPRRRASTTRRPSASRSKLAEEFRNQLTLGAPTNDDEAGLRRLADQIKASKVVVKLFLRHPLHAKLYLLLPAPTQSTRIVGYLGSSNLTLAGLSQQGELNVDVLDHDACRNWPSGSRTVGTTAGASTSPRNSSQSSRRAGPARTLIPPYHIYLKMAYHLSQEARAGLTEFRIPRSSATSSSISRSRPSRSPPTTSNKRGGVLIGDVVGLGKTLMATALARIFEDDHGWKP